jgi:hypothetical protein
MKTLTAIILFFVATNALAQNTAFIARADKAYASRDYVSGPLKLPTLLIA